MYRIQADLGPIKDRRNHREPRHFEVPRLTARAPNEVWSWDISKLATFVSGVFLNLYVVLDMYSRYVVAWMVAEHENSALAKQLFGEALARYGIEPRTLIVHQDRGAPMTSIGFGELLQTLGIDRTYSRPRVSNDNAFSEALFHTAKYQPDYPGRFKDIEHARRWAAEFFAWYNEQHHHDGIALYTPEQVYTGRVFELVQRRQQALDEAYARHPERFVKGPPRAALPPVAVKLNPLDAAPPTAEQIMATPDEDVSALWSAPRETAGPPIINLPGT
jgi:putative transposase